MPKLQEAGIEVRERTRYHSHTCVYTRLFADCVCPFASFASQAYAPCVAGWGFTETDAMSSVGVDAKREQMLAFHAQVLNGRPAVWVGASLGACIALDCYKERPGVRERALL